MSDEQIRNNAKKELSYKFSNLCKHQAAIYKLFSAQPVNYTYLNKKTQNNVVKNGLALWYDNLSAPTYSLEDLKDIKNNKKDIKSCEKKIQPEQFAYKKEIDNYLVSVIKFDEALNKTNKEFHKFCDEYKKERFDVLAGNEKDANAPDSMTSVIKAKTKHRIFDDLEKNMGNEVIKCVASSNINNKKRAKASPTKTKLTRKACAGNVQKCFHNMFRQIHKETAIINVLKPLDLTYLDIQIRKERHQITLEKLARKRNISVEQLEKQLKEK
jgi:hypothetical protein